MKVALNITVKLILYLLIVSVGPLLVFAGASYDLVREAMLKLASEYSSQLVANQREFLQLETGQVERLALRIASIEDISAVAVRADNAANGEHDAYDELSTQAAIRKSLNEYASVQGIVSIDMYTAKGYRFYVGDTLTVAPVDEVARQRIYHAALASTEPVQWLGVETNLNPASSQRKVLTAVKVLRRYSVERKASEPVGMVVIDYSVDLLSEHFRHVDLGKNAYLLVTDARGRLIYSPNQAATATPMPVALRPLLASVQGSNSLRMDGRDTLISTSCAPRRAWCVFGVIPEQTLLTPMARLSQVALGLMLACFAVIAVASRLFRRSMVLPIKSISDGFRAIQAGQFKHVASLPVPRSEDEIRELVVWFNTFLESLRIRQRYEAELLESEHKFSSIFQLSPVPLGMVRLEDGCYFDVNDAWLTQFEYRREDVVGRTSLELNIWVDPQDRWVMLDRIVKDNALVRMEFRQQTKHGRVLICVISGRPFEYQGVPALIFSITDITHQREIEAAIRETNVELEERVRQRTAKLQQANEELEQAMLTLTQTKGELARSEKMAALGSLVAGVAHELNTPLGNSVTVASTLQLMTEEITRQMQSGQVRRSSMDEFLVSVAHGIELLMRNLRTASELISTFKQVAADQASSQRRRFDVKTTFEGVLATLVPMYRKSGFVLKADLPEGLTMDSYPGPIGQVITNFVTNALAHAFDGRETGTMTLRCRQLGEKNLEITFADDGVGILEEHVSRVFDPFFTTKLGKGGSGLGLNIVYNIVTGLLGGTIELQSRVGAGTVFTIVLPLTAKEAATTKP